MLSTEQMGQICNYPLSAYIGTDSKFKIYYFLMEECYLV